MTTMTNLERSELIKYCLSRKVQEKRNRRICSPGASQVLDLKGGNLSSVRTLASVDATVLGTHSNVAAETCQESGQVNVGRAHGNFHVAGNGSRFVQDLDAVHAFGQGTVALPVSSNQVFSLTIRHGDFCGRSGRATAFSGRHIEIASGCAKDGRRRGYN
jgi:hypothetical protein